mmetsp:Transcript_2360/g.3245  ORF Transcript_2360/g.3245 Transcript_2360/m.3245 type:complete len:88 (+) Transcript_2360:14-277(+)
MEGSILALLQGQAPAASESEAKQSKWKSYKQKHETVSSRSDFPLKNAQPASQKGKRVKQAQMSAHQRTQLLQSGCFTSSAETAERVE